MDEEAAAGSTTRAQRRSAEGEDLFHLRARRQLTVRPRINLVVAANHQGLRKRPTLRRVEIDSFGIEHGQDVRVRAAGFSRKVAKATDGGAFDEFGKHLPAEAA